MNPAAVLPNGGCQPFCLVSGRRVCLFDVYSYIGACNTLLMAYWYKYYVMVLRV